MRSLAAFALLIACSHPASINSNGNPTPVREDAGVGMRLQPATTRCFVGRWSVSFHVLIPTTFTHGTRTEEMRLLWSIDCFIGREPVCEGTGLLVSNIEETGLITVGDNLAITTARIVSLDGLTAVVRFDDNTFRVDAKAGTVASEIDSLRVGYSGRGQARCEYHGAADEVEVPAP